jgi:Caspase domain
MRARLLLFATAIGLSFAAPASAQSMRNRTTPVLSIGQTVNGELTPLDAQRHSGKFEDAYLIQGRAGQKIELRLSSDDFDSYLLVTGPGGYQVSNDDGDANSLNSRMVMQLPADGTYRVSATSYQQGATGAYRIEARQPAANASVDQPVQAAQLTLGQALEGRLDQHDMRLGESKFQDRYRLSAHRGDRLRIDAVSREFDTILSLQAPDGTLVTNDDRSDAPQGDTNSRIDTVIAEDGDYLVTVTSFAENSTGKYRLTLGNRPLDARQTAVNGGRVLVVAVGVAAYQRMNALPHTDDDARQLVASLRAAGVLHPASVVLTDAQATKAHVREAMRNAARAAGPNDLVLFFFSGHGDQVDTPRSAAELDGRAETIELYDEALRDTELQQMTDQINARMVLVALDSCFSGGFRNVVDRPNVLGLFSSEEDLTSTVADRFEAGGYLSYYLRTGLAGEADNDGDRIVTAGELTTYLRRNFRNLGDIPASTREDTDNYQYLVVERGGINIEDGVLRVANLVQPGARVQSGGKPDPETNVDDPGDNDKNRRH